MTSGRGKLVSKKEAQMNVLLEIKLPAALIKGVPALAKLRISNVVENTQISGVKIRMESECFEDAAASSRKKLYAGDRILETLRLRPQTIASEEQLWFHLTLQRHQYLREDLKGSLTCRVREYPATMKGLKVIMGDIKNEKMMGNNDSSVGHTLNLEGDHRHGIDKAIDTINEDFERVFEPVSLETVAYHPESFGNTLGMHLIGIEPGEFRQGSPLGEQGRDLDEAERDVELTKPFWISSTTVIQKDWEEVMKKGAYKWEENKDAQKPAHFLSWFEAIEFCERLTKREKDRDRLPENYEYRLPTEAEWEYACRAGSPEPRYGELNKIAAKSKRLEPVARYEPNKLELYDMIGNIDEWCLDSYVSSYSTLENVDPFYEGEKMDDKVSRGGCFQDKDECFRAAMRGVTKPDERSGRVGFRVVCAEKSHCLKK